MATYGCSVSIAISGNTVAGKRGFGDFLLKIADGVFAVKVDPSLGVDEFAVSAQVLTASTPGVWGISAFKVVNPEPQLPPGTYIAVLTTRDGVLEDRDFDVTITTFR